MFLRTTKVKRPDGKVDEYIRLVESDWNNGSPRHRVICNLGRKELLAPHAEALLRLLQGKEKTKTTNQEATAVGAWDWGVMLAARHFWQQLGLQEIIDSLAKNRGLGRDLADRALALVTNRLCEPTSEHGMARWLETDFVCDRWGRRWFRISARERSQVPNTLVQEVASGKPEVRVFVVHSEERLEYERGEREKAMQKVQAELEALEQRVSQGKLKAPEKIGAAASRVLSRHHGFRYYAWELKQGQFHYFEHPENLKQEKALEGKYLIQSEEPNLSPIEAVEIYKDLSEVERAFSGLKDVIEMRPIYHRTVPRVEAHIFIASLAFLLDRALEKKLKSAGNDLSSKQGWQALKTVRVVDIHLGNGEHKQSVTQGSSRAAAILSKLGIKDLDPVPGKTRQQAA